MYIQIQLYCLYLDSNQNQNVLMFNTYNSKNPNRKVMQLVCKFYFLSLVLLFYI